MNLYFPGQWQFKTDAPTEVDYSLIQNRKGTRTLSVLDSGREGTLVVMCWSNNLFSVNALSGLKVIVAYEYFSTHIQG